MERSTLEFFGRTTHALLVVIQRRAEVGVDRENLFPSFASGWYAYIMGRDLAEIEQTERFDALYDLSRSPALQAVTDDVCGCGYIGSSWTTLEEANSIVEFLDLDGLSELLELGAGAGWPGLYLSKRSGCRVTLLDLPETGLKIARERAEIDGISERVQTVVADASNLGFSPERFSAINHSDLLCCLIPKRRVLEACRRVIRPSGRMAFSVVTVAPSLSENNRRVAIENGPPFIESRDDYSTLLAETGWQIIEHLDLTSAYERACERLVDAEERHRTELRKLLGAEEYELRQKKWLAKLSAIQRRLTLREFFLVSPK